MKSLPFLAFIAFLLLIVGCDFAPHYHTPSAATPTAYKETNGWKMAQPADAALKGNWWEMFNDPELNKLEAQVAVSNQNIIAGLENFLAARAVARQAWSAFFPTVTTIPSAQKTTTPGTSSTGTTVSLNQSGSSFAPGTNSVPATSRGFSSFNLPFNASWEPDLWGNIRNTVRESTYAAQASAAQVANLRLTAQGELAQDYFQLRLQDELIQVYNNTVTNYAKSLELTKTLASTGINSDINVAQAVTTLDTAVAEATGLYITRAQLEHAIAMLTGQPPSTFSIKPAHVKINSPQVPIGVPSQLLERRPDIASAERAVAQANAAIGVARAAYFPTVTLNAGTGFQSSKVATLLNASSWYWSIGGTVAETVFDAGRRRAVTQQAWATYNANVATYRQTTLTAFQQVEDDLAALRILASQIEQQNSAVQAAQTNVDLATELFRLGINSYLNVITAEQTLLANQQTAVTLRSQQITDTVALIMALGGGWNASEMPGYEQVLHANNGSLSNSVNPKPNAKSR